MERVPGQMVGSVYRLFSVFDVKARSFSDPISRMNGALAERDFQSIVRDPQSIYSKYPDDFKLYEIGYWSPDTGEIVGLTPPVFICDGSKYASNLEVN